uniref:Methyltransferase type 11 domain-containing protein n=1 Tax=Chromera velia CCMP2878 TaxID=1169474 RepID=A0A0G4GZ74_9ALVE|eukprot:Cvel_5408.t1-p1 / transcript=Cvel_5408.t1 / gene=Cvel_5408 / organism=Chromera_velia_CCMP2878 / gene_product=Uncharacterized methyltransferase YcgJ, putative / transcript_product=Uncharacterized methyltransferase YcgJ, putative / location=Cvel_scaffold252:6602-7435(+) / protein_length=278 / sequence_SO=supercontig / SO=protein_coding / is_pseudo=false
MSLHMKVPRDPPMSREPYRIGFLFGNGRLPLLSSWLHKLPSAKHDPTKRVSSLRSQETNSDSELEVLEDLKEEYAEMASSYDSFWSEYIDKTLQKPLSLAEACNPNVLVDVGCGTGEFLKRVRVKKKKIGVEPSKEMLAKAREKLLGPGTEEGNRVVLHNSSGESLPIPDCTADCVVCTSAFHFFKDKRKALAEMLRVLKPQGKLIITDWCLDFQIVRAYGLWELLKWGGGYPKALTCKDLQELVEEAGFQEVSVSRYTVRFWVFVIWGMQTLTATCR